MPPARFRPPARAAWLMVFAILAVLNAGGYRYGASDQAFYIPAIAHHADPSLFPRDWAMLGAQDRLNAFTPIAGWLVASAGVPLPILFLALYGATLAAIGAGALVLGARLGRSRWTAVAVLAAFTLRHAVALGAVNTLEGYAHPRMLAFGAGLLALAALLDNRRWTVVAAIALAGAIHPTTAIWFAIVAGVGLIVACRTWRPWLLAGVVAGVAVSGWALLAGPLKARLVRMDAEWLSVLSAKRYLFPDRWPASEWLIVAAYLTVIALVYLRRGRQGVTTGAEAGLITGLGALLLVFAAALPLDAARVAFFVQLQVPRVLWIVDLVAVAYFVWFLAEGGRSDARTRNEPAPHPKGQGEGGDRDLPTGTHGSGERCARTVALVILALSLGRGLYVTFVEHPERALVQVDLLDTDWNRSLRWIEANTPHDALVMADPGHAWRYGTSVRVGARRDVLLEEVKDAAMAMYARPSALRVLDRIHALSGFDAITAERARDLDARYGASVLVIDRELALPLLHREGRFRVYALGNDGANRPTEPFGQR